MFTISNQSIINIRSDTDLQSAKIVSKFEFRGYGLRITLKRVLTQNIQFAKRRVENKSRISHKFYQ